MKPSTSLRYQEGSFERVPRAKGQMYGSTAGVSVMPTVRMSSAGRMLAPSLNTPQALTRNAHWKTSEPRSMPAGKTAGE